ncbi:hypothetical protein K788_0007880 (plasmid) [Paraburkholderia caribensis MBA4]|uniref:Uncharacterized protein n=1 Tax=Paraburkholderia caribensis MBA4 TaxID=1323664 RepID=A0A0N7JVM3_9BURK|nr:hypothetical protein K788_0007880 [Paraburkholderia caribensis MBA4]
MAIKGRSYRSSRPDTALSFARAFCGILERITLRNLSIWMQSSQARG